MIYLGECTRSAGTLGKYEISPRFRLMTDDRKNSLADRRIRHCRAKSARCSRGIRDDGAFEPGLMPREILQYEWDCQFTRRRDRFAEIHGAMVFFIYSRAQSEVMSQRRYPPGKFSRALHYVERPAPIFPLFAKIMPMRPRQMTFKHSDATRFSGRLIAPRQLGSEPLSSTGTVRECISCR